MQNSARKMLTKNELTVEQITFVRQTVNHDYFRIMLAGKLTTEKLTETAVDEISIKNEEQQYTPVFVNLLKDYYLHL